MNHPYQPPSNYPIPQNNYPNPQQPQAKYPQLPPIHNPQPYPPQNPQNLHHNQQNQPIIDANHPGYVPPSQYALLGINPIIPDPRALLNKKIRDIDDRLTSGSLFAYQVWLMIMIVCCSAVFGFLFIFYWSLISEYGVRALYWNYFAPTIMVLSLWMVYQGFSVRKAINDKDLVQAKKAYRSMWWFAIAYLVLVVCFGVVVRRQISQGEDWIQTMYWCFIVCYIVPMWINLGGARKVMKLLEKKEAFLLELDTRYSA